MDELNTVLAFAKTLVNAGALKPDQINTLMDLQAKLYDLMFENKDLKEEVRILKEQLAERAKVTNRNGMLYAMDDDGNEYGPICPRCHKSDGITVILFDHGGMQPFFCNTCKNYFDKQHPTEE